MMPPMRSISASAVAIFCFSELFSDRLRGGLLG